jgi:hypothetical protein
MRVAEEPFLTRDSVTAVLRPGDLASEQPFRTLRRHGAASPGIAVAMRTAGGHVLGRLQLYSALNGDAARAFRLRDIDRARAFAERAEALECTRAAQRLKDAVAEVAGSMPTDPALADAAVPLRRYLDLRRRSTPNGLDTGRTTREWLASSGAWLDESDVRAELVAAVAELDRAACEARAELAGEQRRSVSTFFGVVARMDAFSAEVEGGAETVLVPRDDLERHGLAVLGQPVALLREMLPGRGSYLLPMPAVRLDRTEQDRAPSPWSTSPLEDGSVPGTVLPAPDRAWLDRELARNPIAAPLAPLPLA